MKIARFLAITLSIAALGACKTMETAWNDIKSFELGPVQNNEQREAAAIPLICPSVKIVDELSSLSDFSDTSDPAEYNLISRVTLNQVESACTYDGQNAVVDLKLAFEGHLGTRGKAKPSDRPTFSYPFFIAVTDERGEIKAKEIFGASMTYNANEQHHTYYESLRQIIPVKDEIEAREFTVLIGFQLSPQQLKYNRQNMVPVYKESKLLINEPVPSQQIKITRRTMSPAEPENLLAQPQIALAAIQESPVESKVEASTIELIQSGATSIEITENEAVIVAEQQPPIDTEETAETAETQTQIAPEPVKVAAAFTAPLPLAKPAAPVKKAAIPAPKPVKKAKTASEQNTAEDLPSVSPAAGPVHSSVFRAPSAAPEKRTSRSALPPAPSQGSLDAPEKDRDPITIIDLTAPLDQ